MKAAAIRLLAAAGSLALCCGCASLVQKIVPGQPVTAERCRGMDLQSLGFKDGELGQRRGDKFEFWEKDCRMVGVPLDRAVYDQGYDQGLKIYCSCEKGFDSGVRDEFAEMRGQYYTCTRPEYALFLKGHTAGKKHAQDMTLMKKDGPYKMTYFDDLIQTKAREECAAP